MKWLASVIVTWTVTALQQFSWGLLEAYGYDPKADAASSDNPGADLDRRTPEEREADIALLVSHGHF